MSDFLYADEVSKLLNLGDPLEITGKTDWQAGLNWLDYQDLYGIKTDHIPDLIRMAVDEGLNNADPENSEAWAPIHAWRALGQLKAEEAVEPLLGIFHRVDDEDDDAVGEDLPRVMAMIGPAAIQPIAAYLGDSNNLLWARVTAAVSLEKIGTAHPQARLECISALTAVLENYASNDEGLNGELVAALAELDAVEAAPLVEQAFKADRVDEIVMGDWEDFQVEVGLLEERITVPDYDLDFNPFFPPLTEGQQKKPVKKEAKQVKQKRKQAKESRKKNRSKKKKK